MEKYSYHMIRDLDFYRYAFEYAKKFHNVEFLQGSVTHIHENPDSVSIIVNGIEYQGKYLFDSILKPGEVQQDSAAIVRSLIENNHPFHFTETPRRYRLFDSIFLQIMLRYPDDCAGQFTSMFQNNSPDRHFRFLNESGPLWNDLRVFLSLPPYRFIQALLRLCTGRI